jgi:hypothetical protein
VLDTTAELKEAERVHEWHLADPGSMGKNTWSPLAGDFSVVGNWANTNMILGLPQQSLTIINIHFHTID